VEKAFLLNILQLGRKDGNMRSPIDSRAALRILTLSIVGILAVAPGKAAFGADEHQAPQRGSAQYQSWLTTEVRHQLVTIPWLSVFDNLQYRVDGNNVTLMGQVVNPVTKDDAQKAVKGIEGVGQITNQIEVLPVSPMDNDIRRAEFRAIYSFPSLEKYGQMAAASIHIVVKNGHVTLAGVVLNQGDKDAAEIRAKGVPNVFSVTDNLQVENSSRKSGQ
jgi:hyperosmotically inducible protein